jgi:hypothetical protein
VWFVNAHVVADPLRDLDAMRAISLVHRGRVREDAGLIGDGFLVEIEAQAVVAS